MTLSEAYDVLDTYCKNIDECDTIEDSLGKYKLETLLCRRFKINSDDKALLKKMLSDERVDDITNQAIHVIFGEL
jgi:hypothetical protein